MVINTTFGKQEIADSFSIRRESLMHGVPYYTTVQAARMAVGALEAMARAGCRSLRSRSTCAADAKRGWLGSALGER